MTPEEQAKIVAGQAGTAASRVGSGGQSDPSPTYTPEQLKAGGINISSSSLTPQPNIKIPPAPADNTNYSAIVGKGTGTMQALTEGATNNVNDLGKFLKDYLGTPPSSADAYTTASNDVGLQQKQQDVVAAQADISGTQAEIQGISDTAKARILQLQNDAKARGITTAGLAPQEAEINRNAAIAALPLQAKVLAQQAVLTKSQGVLQLAQERLDTLFKLKTQDAQNVYDRKKDLLNVLIPYATTQEQRLIDERKTKDTRNFDLLKDALNNAQTISKDIQAYDPSIASQIAAIPEPILTSPNIEADIASYNKKVAELQGQAKNKTTPYFTTDENGQTVQYQKDATGAVIPSSRTVLGGTNTSGTGSNYRFTSSQLNAGAANAALAEEDFRKLTPEVQNFYINSKPLVKLFKEALSVLKAGGTRPEDVKTNISNMALSDVVKQHLSAIVDSVQVPKKESVLGSIWSGIKNLLGR